MEINNAEVKLVVERLDFEKTFFIDIKQSAVIENITIQFESCIGEWSEDAEGNWLGALNTYYIILSDSNGQETISFMSAHEYNEVAQLLEWKEYKILILYDSKDFLKLMVSKKD